MTTPSAMPGPLAVNRTQKPWGYELLWALTDRYAAKILHVEAGHSLSLQVHQEKHETMYVLSGAVDLCIGNGNGACDIRLVAGQAFHIPAGVVHRLSAIEAADVLEASTPELDDVVRLADDYGRAPGSAEAASISRPNG